jgi:lipoyl(octanoyl) transferase
MNAKHKNIVLYEYLSKISYSDGLRIQEEAQKLVKSSVNGPGGYLYLLEHYPVITNGRFGSDENYVLPVEQIEKLGVEVHKSDRGGDLTYHGPGQLISYPIIDLRAYNIGVKAYINSLEQVLIKVLMEFGIESYRKEGYPGVWTKGQKIASLGVSVKDGITMHGSALNVNTDLDGFSMIVPCGISDVVVTSMKQTLGTEVDMQNVVKSFVKCFGEVFNVVIEMKNGPGE